MDNRRKAHQRSKSKDDWMQNYADRYEQSQYEKIADYRIRQPATVCLQEHKQVNRGEYIW